MKAHCQFTIDVHLATKFEEQAKKEGVTICAFLRKIAWMGFEEYMKRIAPPQSDEPEED